jgi:tetratricopeptide (TPR) repeat protein
VIDLARARALLAAAIGLGLPAGALAEDVDSVVAILAAEGPWPFEATPLPLRSTRRSDSLHGPGPGQLRQVSFDPVPTDRGALFTLFVADFPNAAAAGLGMEHFVVSSAIDTGHSYTHDYAVQRGSRIWSVRATCAFDRRKDELITLLDRAVGATAESPRAFCNCGGGCVRVDASLRPLIDGAASQQANVFGYRAYKAGDLAEAEARFEQAVHMDPNNALAAYNLACTLALRRAREGGCAPGADATRIIDLLCRSIALDAGRLARARVDPDLDSLRQDLAFRLLMERSEGSSHRGSTPAAGVEAALRGATLYGPAGQTLTLGADGRVQRSEGSIEGETWRIDDGGILRLGDGTRLRVDHHGQAFAAQDPQEAELRWSPSPPSCGIPPDR